MSLERLLHVLRLAFKSIFVHSLRSTLTITGIILGVCSVIVMLAIGESARDKAVQQIKDLGATNIIVRSVKPTEEKKETKGDDLLKYGVTYLDLERISSTIPSIRSVTPLREFRKEVFYLDRKLDARVVGAMPNYQDLNGLHVHSGRFLIDRDNAQVANVCVIGAETAEILFPVEDPVGRSISIGNYKYRIVGVTERRAPSAGVGSSLSAQDYNKDVYIPFNTDRLCFGELIVTSRAGSYQAEKLQISQLTVAVDSMAHVKKTADIIEGLIAKFHTQKDTTITVPLDLLEKAEQTQKMFTWVLVAIASISLIVGGIGIMNIMLATVTERTREIGIRRALGAKRRDITAQFLVEAITLSSAGGILGVLLGLGGSFTLDWFGVIGAMIRVWSPVLAFAVSVAVGLIFGTYPALRAARMDPIEALRHE